MRLSAHGETCCATEYQIVNAKPRSVCEYFTHSLDIAEISRVGRFFLAVNRRLVCGLQDAATNRSPWTLPTLSTRSKLSSNTRDS